MSPFQFEAFSSLTVTKKDHDDHVFGFTVFTYSGWDLIKEYLAYGIWPLDQG